LKRITDYKELLGENNPLPRYPQLLEAAIEEFSKKKYEIASLNEILKRAEMSKGSLYHHFGDKFGLFLSLIDLIVARKMSFMLPYLQNRSDNGDFFGTIKDTVRATTDFVLADPRFYNLSFMIVEQSDDILKMLSQYYPFSYSEGFGELIDSAIRSGQIDRRFTPDFIITMLNILFSNAHKLLKPGDGPEEAVRMVDQLMDLMQNGISAKKER